jgi:hypothetical protein
MRRGNWVDWIILYPFNKPFVNGTPTSALAAAAAGKEVSVNTPSEKTAIQGYANYMFWDKEANVLPYFVGSYLGAKKS